VSGRGVGHEARGGGVDAGGAHGVPDGREFAGEEIRAGEDLDEGECVVAALGGEFVEGLGEAAVAGAFGVAASRTRKRGSMPAVMAFSLSRRAQKP